MHTLYFTHFYLFFHTTGEKLTQREDDKAETVAKRLENYQSLTTPLLKYYENLKMLQTFTGTESDKIWPEVKKFIRQLK